MIKFKYIPNGVCAREMIFSIDNNIIIDEITIGGCPGNSQGISKLIKGMDIDEVIDKLKGINCGNRGTSCPDQIARALEQYKKENN